ncbi:MAG: hypothetical protein IR164_07130 [Devosia sp.]|jgi:hypothetical protein|uniref:hypothetical protein n=1 Tax=unclassified Devosia TaxID=196773 RepID=UPI001A0F71A4|nr:MULTISPECIES: hypothetical protein [unclassified Devosia]MBF0678695.1 hypothetical protein [Devosia sp.]WEJ31736.1 hypothetical protein NYQ88_12560 [Devosia sp. SD17-2]
MPHMPFALLLSLGLSAAAFAQEAPRPPALALELNAFQDADAGCRVTFLATNDLGGQLNRAAVEMALFGQSGAIDRIVTLDFKNLAPGKTKVLQFELAGLRCADVSRVLINDIGTCDGEGIDPASCLSALVPTARPDVAFGV